MCVECDSHLGHSKMGFHNDHKGLQDVLICNEESVWKAQQLKCPMFYTHLASCDLLWWRAAPFVLQSFQEPGCVFQLSFHFIALSSPSSCLLPPGFSSLGPSVVSLKTLDLSNVGKHQDLSRCSHGLWCTTQQGFLSYGLRLFEGKIKKILPLGMSM